MSEILSGQSAPDLPRSKRFIPPLAAVLVTGTSFLVPLSSAGLWAPYELEVANLSRRIAVGLHGAQHLALTGAAETIPTLQELGRGQLPFSSVALGFQAFSLSDWAGRVPLAIWAGVGVLALYRLVRHFIDSTAAAYAAAALSTMPLYFLQARTMLGDAVILSSVTTATASFTMLTFGEISGRRRLAWAVLAFAALLTGFLSRGALFGIACPTLAIGLAWLIQRWASATSAGRPNAAAGITSLVLGLCSVAAGTWAIHSASKGMALEVMGLRPNPPNKLLTHDSVLHQLGHGLFPWSAIAPFLLAAAWPAGQSEAPSAVVDFSDETNADNRSASLLLCLGCSFLVALGIHGMASSYTGLLPFVALAAVAGWIAIGFRRLDSGTHRTRLLALGTIALMVILAKDLKDDPNQAMAAFAVGKVSIPESFRITAEAILRYATPVALALIGLGLGHVAPPSNAVTDATRGWLATVAPSFCSPNGSAWQCLRSVRTGRHRRFGNLALLATVVLLLLAAAVLVDQHLLNIAALDSLGKLRPLARVGFLGLPALALMVALGFVARDLVRALMAWLPWPRAQLCCLSFAGFGLLMSLHFYPTLAQQLSPRGVFSEYAKLAAPGDPLAVLGSARTVAPFYTDEPVSAPTSPAKALKWLTANSERRRWLVEPSNDLPSLNSLFRKQTTPPKNLPILFAQSSEVSLSVSELRQGEKSSNPLDAWVSYVKPEPQHPLNVKLKSQLQCLGWSLVTASGKPVSKVRTGRDYRFQIHWKVLAPIHKTWKAFIHIDSGKRRYNGDHDVLGGKYPMRYWNVGDYITDEHLLRFKPHFSGSDYEVYFGLFSGSKRLTVSEGDHHDNRIEGGKVTIH